MSTDETRLEMQSGSVVEEETGGTPAPQRPAGDLRGALRAVLRDRLALLGLVIYAVYILVAVLAPTIAPYGPTEAVEVDGAWAAGRAPGEGTVLGTTNLAKDIFSQLIYGTRAALIVGFSAAFLVVVVGTTVGLIAGYFGGWVDTVLMRFTDLAFGIPLLPLVIVLVAFMGPSMWNIVFAMALLLWRDTGRVIRSQVLTLRERSYVRAARVAGASDWRIIFVHIAPNVLPLAVLYGALAIGWAILTEASVSFLGFGDPQVISWGYMLQDAYLNQAMSQGFYFWFVPPGICIMLAVMAGFFIGRGAEEMLQAGKRREA